jgi:serine/threonine protein kinase
MDDIARLHDQIIASSIPMESLRLVHPMARDLILKVLSTGIDILDDLNSCALFQCLERNPAMRWSIEKIKNHAYFSHVCVNAFFLRSHVNHNFRLSDWEKVSSMSLEGSFVALID